MNTLDVAFVTGGEAPKSISKVAIKALTYVEFVSIGRAAQAMTVPDTMDGRVMRARMMQQVQYLDATGKPVPLTLDEVLKMPFGIARKIQAQLSTDEGKAGKIIGDGDGVSVAVRYELGTPIEIAGGKEPIRELEFLATTYGDLEDVISGQDSLDQTLALIRTVAKPVHDTLSSLPSWGVDRITLADGVTIADKVLSRFLEE